MKITPLAALLLAASCTALPGVTVGSSPGSVGGSPASSPADVDYARIEREVVQELNAARANPRAYASNISALLPYYNGTLLRRPGSSVPVRTVEGAAGAREAIAALQTQSPVVQLTSSSALALAAADLMNDQARTGNVGHTGSDGSTPVSRISAHGAWGVSYSENINYGPFTSGRDVVVDLLIDDGVPDRGHRRNIFDPTARVVGASCGRHPKYGSACVIDQVGSYVPR